jgi:acetylornithine deacetylase
MDELATLARDLVAVPSHDDETAAGDRIEAWLREHTAASVTRDDAGNVLARRGEGDRSLALVGHHDVVPPDDRQVTDDGGYVVEERDGRLHGRGTADMKGAVAAMLLAFRDAGTATDTDAAAGEGEPAADALPHELVFASFVGEEAGGEGCRAAIADGFAPDRAVVGEGSTGYSDSDTLDVAVAHKGRRGSTLVAEGAASHASEPEAGENAIYHAAEAVDVVRDLDAPETTVAGHDLAGSVVVTEIAGGTAMNVVPDHCEVTVDERTVPGHRAPLSRTERVDGVTWQVDQDLPPMECRDEPFRDGVLAAVRDVQDGAGAHVVKPHATDAGWLADAGVACVVCGPAEPGEAHTATESVSLAVLERCYRVYRRVASAGVG